MNSIAIETIEQPEALEDVTREYIKQRLRENGESITEATIEKERRTIILEEGKYKEPIGRILSFSKNENKWWPVLMLAAIGSGVFDPMLGYLLGYAIEVLGSCEPYRDGDGYIPQDDDCIEDFEVINQIGIYAAINAIGCLISFVLSGYILGYIAGWAVLRVRAATFASIVRQEISYHDHPDHSSGIVGSWLTTSAVAVTDLVGPKFVAVLTTLAAFGLAFVISCTISWEISLATVFGIPIIISFTSAFAIFMLDNTPESSLYSVAGNVATDAILNVRTVRALNAQEPFVKVYENIVEEPFQQLLANIPVKAFVSGMGESMFLFLNMLVFGIGSVMIDLERITGSEMYRAQMVVVFGLISSLDRILDLPDMVAAKMAAFDLFGIIDRKSKIDALAVIDPNEAVTSIKSIGDGSVTFNIQDFRFDHRPTVPVLRDVHFTVQPGQTVAFVGPSGSGKSTLIQLLLRFYDASGKDFISVGGTNIKDIDLSWWREQVGLVAQEPVLFDMSVEDNIRYGKPNASDEEVRSAARRANIEFVGPDRSIGWKDSVGNRGSQLSGGQKQRIAIARAIIREPQFLLLDEGI